MELVLKDRTTSGVFWRIMQMANPVFVLVAVFVPVSALVYALASGALLTLNYVHIMAGALWRNSLAGGQTR